MKLWQKFQRNGVRIGLNFAALGIFIAHSLGWLPLPLVNYLENRAYDARMRVSSTETQDPRIVIVDIDELSLAEDGRWPWSRDRMSQLTNNLFDHYHVSIVGFDVLFAEPDNSSGLRTLEALAGGEFASVPDFAAKLDSLRDSLDYDGAFARSIADRPVVLGYYFGETGIGSNELRSGMLPAPLFDARKMPGADQVPRSDGYGANLPELQEQASGGGHFNPHVDVDGIVRRVPLLRRYKDGLYESLSLAVARRVLEVDEVLPVTGQDVTGTYQRLEALKVGAVTIPVDAGSQALVKYRGKRGSYPYISASDVLHERADTGVLEDAIVLVGTSAPGLFDLRATPVDEIYPGVEIHANLIAGILDNDIRHSPDWTRGAETMAMLVVGLAILISIPFLSPLWSMVFAGVLMSGTILANYGFWQAGNIVVPLAATLLLILFQFLINMSYGFFFEGRKKGQITDLFGQYVPPELVEEMSEDPGAYKADAEERELTVLFSDVRGFTTLSEGLTPKELSALMNEFLTELTGVIHQHRGTIDKYMGDAVMAFWGAPLRDEKHAEHGLKAGLAMIEKMYALQDVFEARGWPRLAIGVGLNTGVMSVGNMGSKFRTAYTLIGDEVNLGSRLEGLTKQYGVDMIVGENVVKALPDYVFRELDLVQVKGKHKPIAIYEPLAGGHEISAQEHEELDQHAAMLQAYRAQRWDEVEALLAELKARHGDRHLYDIYRERIAYFRKNPPGVDWDGVFVFTVK